MSILLGLLAGITGAALAAVPVVWDKGIPFGGHVLMSAPDACKILFFATVLFLILAAIATFNEKKPPPGGGAGGVAGPPSSYPHSGDRPRPLSPKLWAAILIPLGTSQLQLTTENWSIIGPLVFLLVVLCIAYLVFTRFQDQLIVLHDDDDHPDMIAPA